MTEAQTPMRCELCKKAPEGNSKIAYCRNDKCALFAQVITRDSWDETQAALIELQRKAFEAGAEFVNKQMLEVQDQLGIWVIRPAWTDYLASRSAK